MDNSERLERYKHNYYQHSDRYLLKEDQKFSSRIAALLNHPAIDENCMVDAYYYDFSAIPQNIQDSLNLYRDVYLIYGITTEGEMITKWVDRWDLDTIDPIVNGKVIRSETEKEPISQAPEIKKIFDSNLLSTPTITIFKKECQCSE